MRPSMMRAVVITDVAITDVVIVDVAIADVVITDASLADVVVANKAPLHLIYSCFTPGLLRVVALRLLLHPRLLRPHLCRHLR